MRQSIVNKMAKVSLLRRYAGRPFLNVNRWMWRRLPASLKTSRAACTYGTFLHSLVLLQCTRRQWHGTFFMRNRPELELIRALSNQKPKNSRLRIAVLGCSNGAEAYSIVWSIRSLRPDLKLHVNALDISKEVLQIAQKGVYSIQPTELVDSPILERLTPEEIETLFDKEGNNFRIKSWIRGDINWQTADAGDPELARILGRQEIVVANKFLCHMTPPDAEKCLRNVAKLVVPGGFLFVSGVDLDVRTRVALDLGWRPVRDMLEEIHDGDVSVRRDWPWEYWGLEPFNSRKSDSAIRYASVFQLGDGIKATGSAMLETVA